jgi:hypothetical protein
LEDARSTPHRQPRRTPDPVIAAIVAARQQRLTGWAIAVRLQRARRPWPRYRGPGTPPGRLEPAAARGTVHARSALRADAPGRARAPRHQAVGPHSAPRSSDSRRSPTDRRRRRLRVRARCGLPVAASASSACSPTTAVPISPACSAPSPRVWADVETNATLSAADQRQGRALHSDAAARVGLRHQLQPFLATHRGAAALAPRLQHHPPS